MMVYRWQNAQGLGPYVGGQLSNIFWESCGEYHGKETGRPTPDDEGTNYHGERLRSCGDVLFGFASLEQESRWFKEKEKSIMRQRGFELVKYEVDEDYTHTSTTQCMFVIKHARRVDDWSVGQEVR